MMATSQQPQRLELRRPLLMKHLALQRRVLGPQKSHVLSRQ